MTISEELEMPLVTVKGAIKELKVKNMIVEYKDVQDRRRNVYIINPNVAWRGKSTERIKTMKKMMAIDPNQLLIFGNTVEALTAKKTLAE